MSQTCDTKTVRSDLWSDGVEREGVTAQVEVERTEPDEIALHTFVDGEGAHITHYVSREGAISLMAALGEAVAR